MRWSYTKNEMFRECPRKFQYEFILKQTYIIKSDAMAIGEGIHKFLEEKAKNDALTADDCVPIYLETALGSKSMVNPKLIEEKVDVVYYYFMYNRFIKPLIIDGKPMVEYSFKWQCNEKCLVSGKIDIISEKWNVVDYKTGTKPYTAKEMAIPEYDKGVQPTIYSAVVYNDFGVLPNLCGYQVIDKDMMFAPQNIGFKPTLESIDNIKKIICSTYDKFENYGNKFGELLLWPKNDFAKCYWCSYRALCAANKIPRRIKEE